MKTKINKLLAVGLALCLLMSGLCLTASADPAYQSIDGTTEWKALGGNTDPDTGKVTPSVIKMADNGLTVTYTGGNYQPGESNAGVMYALPVDISDFSVEFTVTKKADNYNLQNTGVDSWISLCLLNKPDTYFNVKSAGKSQGIVTLIRPMAEGTLFNINMMTNSWSAAPRLNHTDSQQMNSHFKVEIKKGDDGLYDYYVNGTQVDFVGGGGFDFTTAFTKLMEKGDVYFYMGVSSYDFDENIEWRIEKVNGKAVKPNVEATTTTTKKNDGVTTTTTTKKDDGSSATTTTKKDNDGTPTATTTTGTDDQTATTTDPDASASVVGDPDDAGTSTTDTVGTTSAVPDEDTDGKTDTGDTTGEQEKANSDWIVWVVVGAVVVAAAVVVVVIVLKKKK